MNQANKINQSKTKKGLQNLNFYLVVIKQKLNNFLKEK